MEWSQPALFTDPDAVREITVSVGIVGNHHLQWQVLAHDKLTGAVIHGVSRHHADPQEWREEMDLLARELKWCLENLIDPF